MARPDEWLMAAAIGRQLPSVSAINEWSDKTIKQPSDLR